MQALGAWLVANPHIWLPYAYIAANIVTSVTKTEKDDLILAGVKKALVKAGLLKKEN